MDGKPLEEILDNADKCAAVAGECDDDPNRHIVFLKGVVMHHLVLSRAIELQTKDFRKVTNESSILMPCLVSDGHLF